MEGAEASWPEGVPNTGWGTEVLFVTARTQGVLLRLQLRLRLRARPRLRLRLLLRLRHTGPMHVPSATTGTSAATQHMPVLLLSVLSQPALSLLVLLLPPLLLLSGLLLLMPVLLMWLLLLLPGLLLWVLLLVLVLLRGLPGGAARFLLVGCVRAAR